MQQNPLSFQNETADDSNDLTTGGENSNERKAAVKKSTDDQVEGDEYFKCTLIKFPGFLTRIVQLIGSSYRSIQRRAIILLGSLSEVEEAVVHFEHIPWLDRVAGLIQPGTEPVVLDWAVLALKNFAILHTVQEEIIRRGMLDQLLDLVTTDQQTDPDVTENTLQARFAQHSISNQQPNPFQLFHTQ